MLNPTCTFRPCCICSCWFWKQVVGFINKCSWNTLYSSNCHVASWSQTWFLLGTKLSAGVCPVWKVLGWPLHPDNTDQCSQHWPLVFLVYILSRLPGYSCHICWSIKTSISSGDIVGIISHVYISGPMLYVSHVQYCIEIYSLLLHNVLWIDVVMQISI